ncbi:MAG: DUF4230 domain-containing protein, partial [Treponema sp.]|nr:DUF4230 domain-containing protein [Treponema sp.]
KLNDVSIEKQYMTIEQQLQYCQELTTIKKQYSNIVSIKKQAALGLAKSYSIVKYTGIIRVGIEDITAASIMIHDDKTTITITIPPPVILGNDLSSLEVFDEKQSIFVPIQTQEIFSEIQSSRQQTVTSLIDQGLLSEAQDVTRTVIQTILFAAGYKTVFIQFK